MTSVSEGVLIPDISCSHASPLVIVYKKGGGIRMAVDYREVNQFSRVSANQLPYHDILFQLAGQIYYAKVDNLWGYHQLKLDQQSSRVTAFITPWGCIAPILPLWNFDGSGRISISSQNGSSSIRRILSQWSRRLYR